MTASDWGVLCGIVAIVAIPGIGSMIAVWVKLTKIETLAEGQREDSHRIEEDNKRLWTEYGAHTAKLSTHDMLLSKIVDKLAIRRDG